MVKVLERYTDTNPIEQLREIVLAGLSLLVPMVDEQDEQKFVQMLDKGWEAFQNLLCPTGEAIKTIQKKQRRGSRHY